MIIEAQIRGETKGFRNRIETIVQIIFTNWRASASLCLRSLYII